MKKVVCLIVWGFIPVSICMAQIRVTPINADEWVKKNFSGQGIVVANVKQTGSKQAVGAFTSSANVLQISKGLVLSTGYATGVSGPNTRYNQTKGFGDMKNPGSDPDISKLISAKLYDVCILEFDFVPLGNSLQFNYQFGSDEYPEWVGNVYNDIFAFFISDETSTKNIALIPGKSVPVSINTINSQTESDLFLDNNVFLKTIKRQTPVTSKTQSKKSFPGNIWQGIKKFFTTKQQPVADIEVMRADAELLKKVNQSLYRNLQYDGITKKLVAQTYVEPYKKYHLKIIIADVSDNLYDSGVFIEDRSLTAKRDTLQPGFVDYPDYSKIINPRLILEGKKLADILPPKTTEKTPAAQSAKLIVSKTEKEKLAAENVTIYFDIDKTVINPAEMTKLRKIAEIYDKIKDNYNIRITGHTDNSGSLDYNLDLSKRRDQSVIDTLRKLIKGSTFNVLSVTEKAFLQPAADNSTDDGRTKNRRVEIIFVKKE
jgi:outer membrane protein OmpA-like peptidoglycan-associated protein